MYAYFDNQLMVMGSCPNRRCNWEVSFNLRKKKGIREDMMLVETSNSVLEVAIPNARLIPYKMVEMYKNYKPYVPDKFQLDELYDEPSA